MALARVSGTHPRRRPTLSEDNHTEDNDEICLHVVIVLTLMNEELMKTAPEQDPRCVLMHLKGLGHLLHDFQCLLDVLLAIRQHGSEAQALVTTAGHGQTGQAVLDHDLVALFRGGAINGTVRALATGPRVPATGGGGSRSIDMGHTRAMRW